LLDALWPGTVVVDNALQRVVSLVRSALAEAGFVDAGRWELDGSQPEQETPDRTPGPVIASRENTLIPAA